MGIKKLSLEESRHKKGVEPTYTIPIRGSGLPVSENQVKPTLKSSMDVNADVTSNTVELSRFRIEVTKANALYVMSLCFVYFNS